MLSPFPSSPEGTATSVGGPPHRFHRIKSKASVKWTNLLINSMSLGAPTALRSLHFD